MKKIFFILPLLIFVACDDNSNEEISYINCKWLKTRTLINTQFFEIVYCESDCPEGDTVYDCEWVHLYQETQIVEYKLSGSSAVNTWDLTSVTSYNYDTK